MKRFEVGDIVFVQSFSPLYPSLKTSTSFGIIKGKARLLYVHDWETEEVLKEFWAYDVIVTYHPCLLKLQASSSDGTCFR